MSKRLTLPNIGKAQTLVLEHDCVRIPRPPEKIDSVPAHCVLICIHDVREESLKEEVLWCEHNHELEEAKSKKYPRWLYLNYAT